MEEICLCLSTSTSTSRMCLLKKKNVNTKHSEATDSFVRIRLWNGRVKRKRIEKVEHTEWQKERDKKTIWNRRCGLHVRSCSVVWLHGFAMLYTPYSRCISANSYQHIEWVTLYFACWSDQFTQKIPKTQTRETNSCVA